MQFQSPIHLWGLLLVLIPILIHLFSFRLFKTVVISDVSLLKDIRNSGVARKKLKEVVVLLARILSVIFLVLAFSDPSNDTLDGGGSHHFLVKIHIDNSLSMAVQDERGELLQVAKWMAESIIDSYEVNDRFQIQSNDFDLSHEQTWQKKEAKNKISEIKLSSTVRDFKSILTRMNENQKDNDYIVKKYVVSDFEYPIDTLFLKSDSSKLNCLAVRKEKVNNLYIDSVWFSTGERKLNEFDTLHFSMINSGSNDLIDFPVNLNINGNTQFTLTNVPANSKVQGLFVYKVPSTRKVKGVVSIKDDVLSFDNTMHFSYSIPEKIKVLVVSNSSAFSGVMANLYSKDLSVDYDVVSDKDIDYKMINEYDIFMVGELNNISLSLKSWLGNVLNTEGKQVVLVPSHQIDLTSYNALGAETSEFEFSSVDSGTIDLLPVEQSSAFFDNVFTSKITGSNLKIKMPIIKQHYELLQSKGESVLLKSNRKAYLTKSKQMTLFSSGITEESSDFSKHPLVVPVFYKIVFSAVFSNDLYAVYGEDPSFGGKKNWGQFYDIRSPDSAVFTSRFTDELNDLISLDDNFDKAGIYDIVVNDSLVDHLAVNYSRNESSGALSMYEELKKLSALDNSITLIEQVSSTKINKQVKGSAYWKLFLVLAGLCLVLEMVLIKFVFRAKVGSSLN